MSNAKNLVKLSQDDLIALRKQGLKNREVRLSTANSKGRKLGFLGAEYSQRQQSNYLRNFTSEDIAVALYEAGKISIWDDQFKGKVFGFTDESGDVPDDIEMMPVTDVEQIVRAWAAEMEEAEMEAPKAKSTRSKAATK